ncbi:MAG TPA: CHAT domain-containing protein [Jatrophihabitantaceae bacterium]
MPGESSTELVLALHARGVAANAAGRPVRGARAFRRGLALLANAAGPDSDPLTARLLLGLASSETEIGGVAQGLPYLVHAQRIAAASDDLEMRALLHGQHGFLLLRSGRLDEALRQLDAAIALLEHVEPADQCRMLLNRGHLHLVRGELARARVDSRRCAELAMQGGLTSIECKARHNLGYLEFLRGDLPAALRLMDEAMLLGPDVIPGISRLDRARVLVEAGLTREADETLAEAGDFFAANRMSQDRAEGDLARAECALLDGELVAARRLAIRARNRFARLGNDRWRRSAELMILQADVTRGRIGPSVEQRGRRLAAELSGEGLVTQSRVAAFVTAEALLARGRVEEARAVANTVGPARRTDPVAARLHTRYLRARLAQCAGEHGAAARSVRAGLVDLATHQARFGSIDLRTASAVHGRRLAELGVAIALAQGRPGTVFAASERGRAASTRLPAIRPPADERTAELFADLRQTVENLRAVDGAAAAALRRTRRQQEREIIARSWTLAGDGAMARPASLGAVRAEAAATGSAIVTYVQAGPRLHAVVVGAGATAMRALGPMSAVDELLRRARADLDVLAYSRLPGGLRGAAHASLRHCLDELDRALLAPLELSSSRLVVVPTGPLGALPWGLLPSCRGVPVTVAPSATAWVAAPAADARPGAALVALAGPDLARGVAEIETLGRVWPRGRVRTSPAATRAELRGALSAAGIVHVAAHGRHQTENPLFSSIRLADGPLFAYELDQAAPHVILSACELGLATIRPGDEALGLTSVLLHLGTRSVIAGVARVDDDVAAEVMVRYHRELAAGRDSAEALAIALPDQLDAPAPAPFVCFGGHWRYSNAD